MVDPSERRAFPRRAFEKTAQAYESGARLACRPIDVSLGGAFLRVRDAERFKLGDMISVVFGPESGWASAIYVFGRVVRLQGEPSGVALAWERAVTTGEKAYLASFLNKVLGLKSQVAESHAQGATGRFRSVFSFDVVQRAGEHHRRKLASQAAEAVQASLAAPPVQTPPPVEVPSALAAVEVKKPARPVSDGPRESRPSALPAMSGHPELTPGSLVARKPGGLHTRSIVSRLADSRARAGLYDPGTLRDPFDERTPTPHEVGALTSELRATDQPIPTRISATLEVDGASYPATISLLGTTRLTVVAVNAPAHVPSHLRLAADLPVAEGPRPIVADCAVHGFQRDQDGTTFDLAIDVLDEADDPGVLTRYLKWLYFQALAGTES